VTVLELTQTRKLDPIHKRPDLAITPREVTINGSTLSGTVHNIGGADVPNVVVGVVDRSGKLLVRQTLGPLPAPRDLFPKRTSFQLELPPGPHADRQLVLDPDNAIAELYEGNNEVPLKSCPCARRLR